MLETRRSIWPNTITICWQASSRHQIRGLCLPRADVKISVQQDSPPVTCSSFQTTEGRELSSSPHLQCILFFSPVTTWLVLVEYLPGIVSAICIVSCGLKRTLLCQTLLPGYSRFTDEKLRHRGNSMKNSTLQKVICTCSLKQPIQNLYISVFGAISQPHTEHFFF